MMYELHVTGIDINRPPLLISRWSKEISLADAGHVDKWRVSAAAFSRALTSVNPHVRAGLSGPNDKSKEQRLHPVVSWRTPYFTVSIIGRNKRPREGGGGWVAKIQNRLMGLLHLGRTTVGLNPPRRKPAG